MPTKKASNQNATLVCSTTEKAVRKVALFLLGQFRVGAHRRRRSFVIHPENTENTDSFAEAPQSRKRGQSPFLRDGDTAGDTTLPINGLRKTLGMTSRTPVNVQGTLAGFIAPITLPHAQLIDIALQHASANGPSSTGEDDQKQDISDGGDERKSTGQGILKPNQSTGASEKKCTRCIELEIQCNFTYSVKKRGPPKGSVRSGASTQYQLQGESHLGSPNNTATLARSYHLLNGGPSSIDTSITNSLTSPYPGSVGAGLPLSRQKYTLTQFFDREVVQRLIYLYIDYLWHLTPCFHIPSFLADFSAQRDLHDTDFLAVVMALSTFTLVALPKAWLPLEKSGIYQKVWDSLEGLQAILFTLQNYPPTLSTKARILSELGKLIELETIWTSCSGNRLSFTHHNLDRIGVSSAYLGVALKGSHYLRLFDPLTYLDLNPIDAEVAKRLYWLIHGGDKTAAALVSLPFAISTRNSLSLLLVTQSDTPVLARSSDYGNWKI
ncbi:hypothetical protein QFC21_001017 [Naganishia friedmannii]|uniref:Uncharacterized protein n=1 Tax=Naganishia friedmannii TaxID=89922 RepID=A0ACC2W773_9TREE|nr:hypothetical protein QFC21_001017 [Naganishia friedmannii]